MDGTLLHSMGSRISERNKRALLAAEAAGVEIVIATGRRQNYAMPLLVQLGLRSDTVIITSNGTVTRTFAGERIARNLLPVETARTLCGLLREYGTMVFTFDRSDPADAGKPDLVIESVEQLHTRIAMWVEANRSQLTEVSPLERAFDSGEVPVQGMVCGTVQEMREAEARLATSELAGALEMHRTEYPARDLCILDLLPRGVSKGRALKNLAESRGLRRDQVLAIGDNYNDVEMMEYAGHAALMANSTPELQEMAAERGWTIPGTNDEDGVALAIEAVVASAVEL